MKFDIECVILAGGKSSRMGQNKALLPFGKFNSLAEFQFCRLKPLFKHVYISVKDGKDFNFEADFIEDAEKFVFSPAHAVLNVLKTLKKSVFVISVDTPFIDENTIKKIVKASDVGTVSAFAKSGEKLHTLCAVYSINALNMLEEMTTKNEYKLQNIIKALQHKVVEFTEEELFLNINYIEDYEKAKKLL